MTENFATRLKIYFEKEPNIERVIEVPKNETLEFLHLSILAAIDFAAGEYASFWLTAENTWTRSAEVPLTNMDDLKDGEEPTACMKDVPILAAINEKQNKLIYEYDMLLMWQFKIEWLGDFPKNTQFDYPILVSEKGKAPNQNEAEKQFMLWQNDNVKELEDDSEDMFNDGGGYDEFDAEDLAENY